MRSGSTPGARFTDFVLAAHGSVRIEAFKAPSCPDAPVEMVRAGLKLAAPAAVS